MLKHIRQGHAIRQYQIMEAVTHLITSKGLDHVTIKDIAREVGLTEGAVYRHFVSKQQILSYLIYQVGEFLLDTVRDTESEEGLALEKLEVIFRVQLKDIESNWGLALIVVVGALAFEDADLRPEVASVLTAYLDSIKGILEQARQEGSLRPELDIDAAAYAFFSTVQSVASLWVLSEYPGRLSQQGDQVWEIYKRGVASNV